MASKVSNDGGYDANFVEDVPEFLQCVVCQLALRKPVLVIDCGHRFCECCFERMKLYSISSALDFLCPLDREVIEPSKVFPDKGIERVVLDLKVNCDNKDQGCDWSGDLRSLKVHVNTDCLFEMDSCVHNGCTVKMERGKLKEHMNVCLKDGNVSERLWDIVTTLTQRMDNYEEEMRKKDNKIEEFNKQIQEKEILLQKYNKDLEETKNDLKQVQERLENISKDSLKCLNCVEQYEILLNDNKDCVERNSKDLQETKEKVKKFDKKFDCLVEETNELRGESLENLKDFQVTKEEVKKFDDKLNCVVKEIKQLTEEMGNKVKYENGYEINKRYAVELQQYSNELHNYMKDQNEYNNVISNLFSVLTDKHPEFTWLIRDYAAESVKEERLTSPSFYTADGYHLKMGVKWHGAMQECLAVYLYVFKSEKSKDRAPFKRRVEFKCHDISKFGSVAIEIESDLNKVLWSGKGYKSFLKMPKLKQCIVDDTLSISFVLLGND